MTDSPRTWQYHDIECAVRSVLGPLATTVALREWMSAMVGQRDPDTIRVHGITIDLTPDLVMTVQRQDIQPTDDRSNSPECADDYRGDCCHGVHSSTKPCPRDAHLRVDTGDCSGSAPCPECTGLLGHAAKQRPLTTTEPDVPVDSVAVFIGRPSGCPGIVRKDPDGSWNGRPWVWFMERNGAPVAVIPAEPLRDGAAS